MAVLDKVIDRWLRLPPPTTGYVVQRDLPIPTRDGVELLADLYAPTGRSSGTILVRSPYGWPKPMAAFTGAVYAARGYHVVLARCRGTFGSGGTFEPMVHEVDDGADTVAWLREQPWFEGRFATFGGSYLGFTQWAMLVDPPPELVAAVITIGPHDFYSAAYNGGAFTLNDFLGWSNQTARQEEHGPLGGFVRQILSQRALADATKDLPLVDAGERLLGGRAPWYRDWASRRDPDDPFWSPMALSDAVDRVQVPVLLQTGWQDLFLEQTLEQYTRLSARDVDVALTIGPWTHVEVVTKGGHVTVTGALDWFAEHLAGTGPRKRATPVEVFVTGAEQWRDLPTWPPPASEQVLHLQPGGGLGDDPAPAGSQATFTYDPADPTPSIGGRLLDPRAGGYTDDRELAARTDVAAFTGEPLSTTFDVLGTPTVVLAHTSTNPHVDLFVRLSEVTPDGSSRNVSEGFRRLPPEAATGTVRLELDAVAHRFTAGNRIRLVVAGGSHPRWERNLGTDDDPTTGTRTQPSPRTLDLAASTLLLPRAP